MGSHLGPDYSISQKEVGLVGGVLVGGVCDSHGSRGPAGTTQAVKEKGSGFLNTYYVLISVPSLRPTLSY